MSFKGKIIIVIVLVIALILTIYEKNYESSPSIPSTNHEVLEHIKKSNKNQSKIDILDKQMMDVIPENVQIQRRNLFI